ncbi:hypothetical protein TRFO_37962 [Tritrichomonas foetus]|uniref:Uncharacterized protein n=1 Tax=Tritrichomonas foetus TaxID=1144522 RepID=A0A1J4JFC7_9EUKA|nr:hypothetical protein TRFO_37962 [Tritrichomonas foetus]|eukprot:OHS95932.1 hypothetical protein TRFO_37962 [Tritrichomonas foetus]
MSNNNFNEESYSKEITVIILTSTFIVLFSYLCDLCLYNIKITNENQIIFTFEQISNGNEFASDFNNNNLTSDELHNAIKFLNLPIWIRSYEHCNSSKSEISCQSIIKASESIKSWINTTNNSDYSQYVYSSVQNGLSNRMVYFLGAVLGAIALNLPLLIDPPHEIYNYAKEIKYMPDILNI